MKCDDYICDCCGQHAPATEIRTFNTVKAARWYEWHKLPAVNKEWDICDNCLNEIKNRCNKKLTKTKGNSKKKQGSSAKSSKET